MYIATRRFHCSLLSCSAAIVAARCFVMSVVGYPSRRGAVVSGKHSGFTSPSILTVRPTIVNDVENFYDVKFPKSQFVGLARFVVVQCFYSGLST